MNKAIVIGATGATGQVIVAELLSRGIEVIAFGRTEEKLKKLLEEHSYHRLLSYKVGDLYDYSTIVEVAKDAEVIFLCVGVSYHDKEEKVLRFGETMMKAADFLGNKIVFVDGIYVYGYQVAKGDENHPKQPHTKKGRLKVKLEQLIFSSQWARAKALIVRLPDYYGATSQNSYLQPTLEGVAANKTTIFMGNLKTPREYVYLPDAAKMIVNIAEKEETYGENWNIPGVGLISGKEIIKIAREVTGNRKAVIPLTRISVRLIGLFEPFMKEVVEMMYLTEKGFVLSGEKYENRIGPIPATPYKLGIEETLCLLQEGKRI